MLNHTWLPSSNTTNSVGPPAERARRSPSANGIILSPAPYTTSRGHLIRRSVCGFRLSWRIPAQLQPRNPHEIGPYSMFAEYGAPLPLPHVAALFPQCFQRFEFA